MAFSTPCQHGSRSGVAPLVTASMGQSLIDNVGALAIRIEFWGPFYCNCNNKDPQNSIIR